MKKVLLLLLLCWSVAGYGQTSTFTLSRYTGSYTSIAGGPGTVNLTTLSKDDTTNQSIR